MVSIYNNEFIILDSLKSLVVFHPYQDIVIYITDFLTNFNISSNMPNKQVSELKRLCWAIINDSYRTDCCLIFAPYDIAFAALFIALAKLDLGSHEAAKKWWISINHDMTAVKKAAHVILTKAYTKVDTKVVGELCATAFTIWGETKTKEERKLQVGPETKMRKRNAKK